MLFDIGNPIQILTPTPIPTTRIKKLLIICNELEEDNSEDLKLHSDDMGNPTYGFYLE